VVGATACDVRRQTSDDERPRPPMNTSSQYSDSESSKKDSSLRMQRVATSAGNPATQQLLEYAPRRLALLTQFPRGGPRLHVARLLHVSQVELFKELYNRYVKPSYPESDDYAAFVVARHFAPGAADGYFTKKKTIWCLHDHRQFVPLGFTVVTEKRGGSIKFGPTVLIPERRGRGIGSAFRLLVESMYPEARKAYNTLPDDNPAALGYVLKAGYRVEAHLAGQYREEGGELVVGKLLKPATIPPCQAPVGQRIPGRLIVKDGNELVAETRWRIVGELLRDSYDEVDSGFVDAIERTSRTNAVELSGKSKRLCVAFRGHIPVGVLVATPKRGHALKCSPFVLASTDTEAFEQLLRCAYSAFPTRISRKTYIHVPYNHTWLIREARSRAFVVEGLLREPYRPGVDMLVLGRHAGA